jgi:hypothetical protein
MKMGFMFTGLFWGIVLMLLGMSVILNGVFHIHIPLFRIIMGVVIIYFGFKVMLGNQWHGHGQHALFSDVRVDATMNNGKEFNVIFGKGDIDFSNIELTETRKVKVNTIFGGTILKISPQLPLKIIVSAVFSGANLPDGNMVSFGDYTYQSENFSDGTPYLEIDANVVFGGLDIIQEK